MAINEIEDGQPSCSPAIDSVDPVWLNPSMVINVVGDNQSASSAASVEIHSIDPTSASTAIRDHGIYFSTQNDSILYGDEETYTSLLNHSTNISVSEEFTSLNLNADCNTSSEPQVFMDEMSGTSESFDVDAMVSEPFDAGTATEPTIDFQEEIANSTISYLKMIKHQSKRSPVKLQEFAKMSTLLFAHKFDDRMSLW